MTDERKNCPMRHENGNCLPCGGFCLAVSDEICHALLNAYDHGYGACVDSLWNNKYNKYVGGIEDCDDWEKLVKLINHVSEGHVINLMQPGGAEELADYLIANGVTVRQM